jgi:hypothetical protein
MAYFNGRPRPSSLTVEDYMARLQSADTTTAQVSTVLREDRRAKVAVHLRNLETLIAELRDVLDADAHSIDMAHLLQHVRCLEVSLQGTVDKAAREAGLVAIDN